MGAYKKPVSRLFYSGLGPWALAVPPWFLPGFQKGNGWTRQGVFLSALGP